MMRKCNYYRTHKWIINQRRQVSMCFKIINSIDNIVIAYNCIK